MNKQNSLIVIFSIIITFLFINNLTCQSLTKENIKDSLINKMPSFSIYKDNYFITGVPTNITPTKYNADVKYQVSFKQLLFRKAFKLEKPVILTT